MFIFYKSDLLCALSLFFFSTIVFAQKKVETFYFNSNGDTVQTKDEASYYRVVQTNGKNRIVIEYDSTDLKLEETVYRKDRSVITLGDSVWWKYGAFREWYPSGQLKVEGNFVFNLLHDRLKTYYPNGALRRYDVYKGDSLVRGACYAEDSNKITYITYQEKAEFKGGQQKMFEFLADNIKYPKEARENSIEGLVYVGFVVSKVGEIENVKIRSGVHSLLDEEAIRVVKAMPKWKPGKQEGELVRVSYTLPVRFRFE